MAQLEYYRSLNPEAENLSYSILNDLNCPRFFQIVHVNKHVPSDMKLANSYDFGNVDFAFGHCVAAGVQAYFAGMSEEHIFMSMFVSWDIDPVLTSKRKSFWEAVYSFTHFLDFIKSFEAAELHGWEVATLPDGRPAVELNFNIRLTEQDDNYGGHIDILLYHPVLKKFRVLEIKTSGEWEIDEATWKNSSQATGYSLITSSLARHYREVLNKPVTNEWDVVYLVYQCASNTQQWHLFTFPKTAETKIEFITTTLMQVEQIKAYKKLNFFPKNGARCRDYGRRCPLFNQCDMKMWLKPAKVKQELFLPLAREKLDWHSDVEELTKLIQEEMMEGNNNDSE